MITWVTLTNDVEHNKARHKRVYRKVKSSQIKHLSIGKWSFLQVVGLEVDTGGFVCASDVS
jgi:hypothetical protein